MIDFNLTHTRLIVDNFKACLRFYTGVLGLSLTHGEEDWGYVDFYLSCGLYLALVDRKRAGLAEEEQPPLHPDQVCLVFTANDMDDVLAHLQAQGVALVQNPKERWGMLMVRFRDPDGNLIEITAPAAG
jgi:catechol 2,3-dioxygenase-like lactoylglutathione lyase family enzyme